MVADPRASAVRRARRGDARTAAGSAAVRLDVGRTIRGDVDLSNDLVIDDSRNGRSCRWQLDGANTNDANARFVPELVNVSATGNGRAHEEHPHR